MNVISAAKSHLPPTPNPSPQGGGESHRIAALSSMVLPTTDRTPCPVLPKASKKYAGEGWSGGDGESKCDAEAASTDQSTKHDTSGAIA